jgi:hypothetical protein
VFVKQLFKINTLGKLVAIEGAYKMTLVSTDVSIPSNVGSFTSIVIGKKYPLSVRNRRAESTST